MDPAVGAAVQAIATLYPSLGIYLGAFATIVTAAISIGSILATVVPAPSRATGLHYWIYTVVNFCALARGHAASLSAPSSAGIVGGPGAIAAPRIATASTPLAAIVIPSASSK
jgi:hypothetical protein